VRLGDRVEIRGRGTSFVSWRGVVTGRAQARGEAGFMVLLDTDDQGERTGYEHPIYFGPSSLLALSEDSTRHFAGAE
jgi:hypothetical protein